MNLFINRESRALGNHRSPSMKLILLVAAPVLLIAAVVF
jgi:hypothetical protein